MSLPTIYPLFERTADIKAGFFNVYDEYADGRLAYRFASNPIKSRAEADHMVANLARSPSTLCTAYRIRVRPK